MAWGAQEWSWSAGGAGAGWEVTEVTTERAEGREGGGSSARIGRACEQGRGNVRPGVRAAGAREDEKQTPAVGASAAGTARRGRVAFARSGFARSSSANDPPPPATHHHHQADGRNGGRDLRTRE
ncbi:unnamed protein product [Lampetra planeri]